MLNPAGPQAGRIGRLWWFMLYVCAAVFITVMIAIFVAVFRARQKQDATSDAAPITPEPRSEQRMARVVTGAVLATALILSVFLVASFRTGRATYTVQDSSPVSIKVTGHQWWWEFEYEDATPSNTFKTANEIHVPVGRTVQLALTSTDVIHSFWVPNLDGKKDLLPGHYANIWLRADREGEFYGQCAEFCGHQHAHMRFVVVAESPDKFNAWVEAQRKPAAEPADAAQSRGQQVFLTAPCIMCHTVRGTDASGSVAPDLTHLASRKTIAAGTLPLTRGHLAGWIANSQEIKPGNRMPPVPLPPEDLQTLVSYLESLK
ncbi:MAG TPA: cytochrome c oxidase subunit II [Pyrinomonadaceae bacterium]|nr:cytochrome c oxidase subunit II [Pyrinomonadaceae bacterium]